MKGQTTNILAVVAVVAVVAGAAWFKSHRSQAPAEEGGTTSDPVLAAQAAQPTAAPAETVAEGTPCPEPVPTSQPAVTQAAEKANSPAAEAKLPRLVDLGAQSCKACKALAPILEALREEYKGRLDVEFIDVWKDPSAKVPYKIRVIPTQVLFDQEGKEVWRHEGFISKEDLKTLFAERVGVK
ncbi:MAG: thioredoxin family protein [Planctomycetes bacterium]|nr:thioredoxin family protein [Planctomycetota bacterium]